MMKKILCLLLTCLFGGVLFVETSMASICDSKETAIFFGNGVITTEKKAFEANTKIQRRLEAELPQEEFMALEYKLAYNETYGLPLDLLESTIQVLTGNVSRFWQILAELEPMPDWFADTFLLLSTTFDKSALLTTDSLKEHVALYRAKIAEGKKVILVAHSQGNLFGNLAYSLLSPSEQQSFGMVSVANVDNNVLGTGGPYTTLYNDKVILALLAPGALLLNKPMPTNTEPPSDSVDILYHSFINAYMVDNSISSNRIINDVIVMLGTLTEPWATDEPGIITVRLTWKNEPDMDLHVLEPNGMHVYYENAEGHSGTLDRDDRTAPGIEHYVVPTCETLEKGVYHIGLDYFKGEGPETGTVLVEAGILSRTFEEPMAWEYYGDPDHPEIIAHISVKDGENGGVEFNIFPNN